MTIEFGSIKSYNPDRGFGFVRRTFFNPNKNVFFHIRKIQKELPELAPRLDSNETFETINLWYEVETTEKGEQVSKLWLNADNIPQSYAPELDALIQKVESIWKNINSPKHTWLDLVTIKLVGVERKNELSDERDNIKNQLRAAEEERLREAEALRENEIARAKALRENEIAIAEARRENEIARIAEEYRFGYVEAKELRDLVEEMRPLNFKFSKQLSAYIVKHKPGYRYPHISGIVKMERHGGEWNFHGGFPPDIYKKICDKLKLDNQGTDAEAVEFLSFNKKVRWTIDGRTTLT
ncbi:MAG: hypothetical protein WBG73_06240 [Coleofasciculaceae cyanobacterium]